MGFGRAFTEILSPALLFRGCYRHIGPRPIGQGHANYEKAVELLKEIARCRYSAADLSL